MSADAGTPRTTSRLGGLARRIGVHLGRLAPPGVGRATLCSPLVGIVAGLGAVAFVHGLDWANDHILWPVMHLRFPPTAEDLPHLLSRPYPWWAIVLLPTVGGLSSGLLVFSLAPEAEGHGTDALIRAFHRNEGRIRTRVPFVKAITSILTIGTGGSAGQEGPITQIGAGFGSFLAKVLRLTPDERRVMILAGASGGIGAIFRAPLGGALFGVEILYRSSALETAALWPCLAASITAYTTFALFRTPKPLFAVPPVSFHGLADLPGFALLALVLTIFGGLFVHVYYGLREHVFAKIPLPEHVKPAIGGLAVGLLGLLVPEVLGSGYGWVQWGAIGEPSNLAAPGETPFSPNLAAGTLVLLALMKIVATSLTLGSGGSGGTFGPSVWVGGMLGGAVGLGLRAAWPSAGIDPAAYVLVGMGGFFAGVSKAPIASLIIVSEITGSYSLLVPLILVCGLTFALSKRWTLFPEQVVGPADSPAHRGELLVDVLEGLRVADAGIRTEGLERIPAALPFDRVLRLAADSQETVFPVVDPDGGLTGIFSLRDIRSALAGSRIGSLVIADDLATRPVVTVATDDDLHTALKRLNALNVDEIPVVAAGDPTHLVGLLSRRSITAAYETRLDGLRTAGQH